jgi:hypothetical protein
MLIPVRWLVAAGLLLLPTQNRLNAAPAAPDTAALEFLGFRAGARLDEMALYLHTAGGRLRCRRSKMDQRVNECRAVLDVNQFGGAAELWVSAMDSVAGVITLSGVLAPEELESWRERLETRYGKVGPRIQGTQSMLQWVRRGRMLRLTWRIERGEKVASVSLVDGRVLDAWSRSPVTTKLSQPAARDSSLRSLRARNRGQGSVTP